MKRWWKSKTIWLAVFTGVMGVGQAMLDSGLMGQDASGYAMIVVAVAAAALRFVTTEPVK